MTRPRLTRADGLALQILAAQELARRPEGTLADWTLGHRQMRGAPLQLPPAQRDLHADPHPFIVIQKAAQVGISEYLINTALWAAACGHGGRGTAIYFMPTESGIRDFVAARVEPAIAQSPTLLLRKPTYPKIRQALLASAAGTRLETNAFDERSVSSFVGLETPLFENWLATAGVSAEYDRLKDQGEIEHVVLFGLPLTGLREDTDDLLNPSRGTRLDLSVTPYAGNGDFGRLFVTSVVGGSAYYAVDPEARYVLAGRTKLGSTVGETTKDLPANKRFYAGGGGSVRGYEFHSIGPLDNDDDPLGGRSLIEVSAELRVRLTDTIGVVPFADGGTVYDSSYPDFDETFRWAAGLGLRYFTGFGPIRLDVAVPLNKRDGIDDDFEFYISFGQAF